MLQHISYFHDMISYIVTVELQETLMEQLNIAYKEPHN